jgi:hypothetical protein
VEDAEPGAVWHSSGPVPLVFAAVIVVALIALWAASRAAITVCVLEVTSGKVSLRRGAIAPRILADLEDVVERPRVAAATLRVVRDAGRARLEIQGDVSEPQKQRLRNVVGALPLAKLANGRRRR